MASDYFNPAAHPDYMHMSPRSIVIYHPAYISPHNLLIQFPQVDLVESDGQPTGVHHQTVLLACQIIANNAFATGFLYYDKLGTLPVMEKVPLDGTLKGTHYYFILNRDPSYKYPIVPCFQQWHFPYVIPACWPTLRPSVNSERRCALTNQATGIRSADVIPRAEKKWFNDNRMSRHREGTSTASPDMANCPNQLQLSHIIARCFRTNLFAIVPKPSAVGTPDGQPVTQYCVHVFSRDAPRFYQSYHNMPVANLDGTVRGYLFARFAWTVFTLLDTFILANVPRNIALPRRNLDGIHCSVVLTVGGGQLYSTYTGRFGTPYSSDIWIQTLVNQPNNTIQPNHEVQPYIAIQPNHAAPNPAVQPSVVAQPNQANHTVQLNHAAQPNNAAQPEDANRSIHEVGTNNSVQSNNAVQTNNATRSNNAIQTSNTTQSDNAVLLEPVVGLNNTARPNHTSLLNSMALSTSVAASNYTIMPPNDVSPTSTAPPNNVVLPALSQIFNVQLRTPRSAPSNEEEMERVRKRIRTGNEDHDYAPR